jgi:hypothetical protein
MTQSRVALPFYSLLRVCEFVPAGKREFEAHAVSKLGEPGNYAHELLGSYYCLLLFARTYTGVCYYFVRTLYLTSNIFSGSGLRTVLLDSCLTKILA